MAWTFSADGLAWNRRANVIVGARATLAKALPARKQRAVAILKLLKRCLDSSVRFDSAIRVVSKLCDVNGTAKYLDVRLR